LVRQRFETVPLYEVNHATVVCTNPQEFGRRVTEHRNRVEDAHRHVVSLLVLSGQLTADEGRALAPDIQITLIDRRKNRSESLPVVEGTSPAPAPR
jgi:hypothetical protein